MNCCIKMTKKYCKMCGCDDFDNVPWRGITYLRCRNCGALHTKMGELVE